MKIIALVIATIMMVAMGTAVFAETLTINDSRTGRSYVAYQIVTGDVSGTEADGYVLSNIKWGDGIASSVGTAGTLLTQDEIDGLPQAGATREAIEAYFTGKLGTTTHPSSALTDGGYGLLRWRGSQ